MGDKKKISFFFGAGAEKDYFNLPSGISFMRNSYLNMDLYEDLSEILSKKFGEKYFMKTTEDNINYYKYSKHNYADKYTLKAIMKKWIFSQFYEQELSKEYEEQLYSFLNQDDLKELLKANFNQKSYNNRNLQQNNNDHKEESLDFLELFKNLIDCEEITKENIEKVQGTFLEKFLDGFKLKKELPTGIAFILDKHFHTIIDPKKFGINNFSKVFNYYWAIFFSIYEPLLKTLDMIYSTENTENQVGKKHPYSVKDFAENIDLLYNDNETWEQVIKIAKGSYYQVINDTFNKKGCPLEICGVMTSNYYKLIELIETSSSNMYAYLNGKLNLFEIPETLEVLDITKSKLPEDKLYFPFVLGQSYTKPIVSKHQVEAFGKMNKILDLSDILVIIGYNINEDDNHINSFIRNFVVNQKKHIIVISSSDNKSEIKNRLKLEKVANIHILKVNYAPVETPLGIVKKLNEKIIEIS